MPPIVAAKSPAKVTLEKGRTYNWCACGRSANQPFCDGSHRGTQFTPLQFEVEEDGEAFLCQCKHTANAPFCDGTHSRLSEEAALAPISQDKNATPTPVPTPEEPHVALIHNLAKNGLEKTGHHGPMVAMGVPRADLPQWDDIQILPAQMTHKPLLDDALVETKVVIGPRADKPLVLDIPLFVSDMSFGALSEEAKIALAKGAELAGTGICSGEGGILPEEQAAKTGTGGHLPGNKVTDKIASVRKLTPGQSAISPATFPDLTTAADFRAVADRVREVSGGIPIGFKLSANRIENDIAFALEASADYIILDGRGGGTGAAPALFRDHISIPTMAVLGRARRYLDAHARDVTLIITGGLRVPSDFIKALALGADAIALSNSAIQAIGCVGARMCNTNNCPSGIATQNPELRARLVIENAAQRLARFFETSAQLIQVMARACSHDHIDQFNINDVTSWKRDVAELAGISFAGHSKE